jgi:hypothetical protein
LSFQRNCIPDSSRFCEKQDEFLDPRVEHKTIHLCLSSFQHFIQQVREFSDEFTMTCQRNS